MRRPARLVLLTPRGYSGREMHPVIYFLVFLTAVAIDTIPIFAPPAWPILILMLVHFDLNPWAVILIGVTGMTLGRFILGKYIPWVSRKILNSCEDDNLKFLGSKLSQAVVPAFIFVLLYSLTPLSTTALFTAAGIAKVKMRAVLPPFFIGKLISYSVLILGGRYTVENASRIFEQGMSWKTIVAGALGLLLILGFLFIDWRQLLLHRKFVLRFRIWKSAHAGPCAR